MIKGGKGKIEKLSEKVQLFLEWGELYRSDLRCQFISPK